MESALGVLVVVAVAAAVGYEPPSTFAEVSAGIVALAALAAALAYLGTKLRLAFRWLDTIHRLATRELEANGHEDDPGGDGSMKQDLHGVAVALGRLERRVDEAGRAIRRNSQRLDRIEDDFTTGHHHHTRNRQGDADI